MAERLLDHYPSPLLVFFRYQTCSPEARDNHAEEAVGYGEVEEVVTSRPSRLVQPRQMLAEPAIGFGIIQITLQIRHALGQPAPGGCFDTFILEFAAAL